MKQTFHPAMFLGTVIVLCAAWLWARQPVPAVAALSRDGPRPALVEPPSITLETALLERYAGNYEGRGGFTAAVALHDGKLIGQAPGVIPFELRATSETEFFAKGMGFTVEFDVARDGTVRGFAANTEFGVIRVKRVR
jgi:hypothetical protein